MNFLDALKSGRPFHRPSHCVWFEVYGRESIGWVGHGAMPGPGGSPIIFGPTTDDICMADILADDWETQEVSVSLTRTQFLDVYYTLRKELGGSGKGSSGALERTLDKLGLGR